MVCFGVVLIHYLNSSFNTSAVTTMERMFRSCESLSNIDSLANWNVSSVTTMQAMFCLSNITDVSALSLWNVSSLTNMQSMFDSCSN